MFDDLLGTTKKQNYGDGADLNLKVNQGHLLDRGITVTWLSRFLRMPRSQVVDRLKDCPVIGTVQNGGNLYDGPTAMRYLVEPKTDVDAYLQTIKADRLPEKLRETYWNAKIKEAKFKALAGELWPTQSVLDVFGETFKTIKNTTLLWVDTIDEESTLSDDQRAIVINLVDGLLDELHKSLVTHAQSSETESFLRELDPDEAAAS